MSRGWRPAIALLGTLLMMLAAACNSSQPAAQAQAGSGAAATSTPPPASTGVATATATHGPAILKLTKSGQLVRTWSIDELQAATTFHRATVDGEQQEGPLLVDVLRASNVGTWTAGEVIGQGPQRSFPISMTIKPGSIDDSWIFDVNQQGGLKLAVPSKPRDQWARFVSEIRLQ